MSVAGNERRATQSGTKPSWYTVESVGRGNGQIRHFYVGRPTSPYTGNAGGEKRDHLSPSDSLRPVTIYRRRHITSNGQTVTRLAHGYRFIANIIVGYPSLGRFSFSELICHSTSIARSFIQRVRNTNRNFFVGIFKALHR